MIEAVEVVRDKEGGYIHPEWGDFVGDRECIAHYEIDEWEKANGCYLHYVFLESTEDEGSEAYKEYRDGGGGFSKWELYPPTTDAVLLAIHDTEDTPMQVWAVPFTYDLVAHLDRQRAFSEKAFGPGARVEGISDHIKKELVEVAAAPEDISEWIDIVLLGLDGAWRAGHDSRAIAEALGDKLAKNERRLWPDWRTVAPDKAIEHNREAESNA